MEVIFVNLHHAELTYLMILYHPKAGIQIPHLDHDHLSFRVKAWRAGDIEGVGQIFRLDGHGLRDVYEISGPELETMCDLVRSVPGVLGERMLGGGDKGAAGALVLSEAVEAVRQAVLTGYPRSRPDFRKTILSSERRWGRNCGRNDHGAVVFCLSQRDLPCTCAA